MRLEPGDVEQFFRLLTALIFFVNQRLKVIDEDFPTPEAYAGVPPENRFKIHKALIEHRELIDAFADENPFGFDEGDLEIIRSWRHLVAGKFYAFRQLQKYMVFLTASDPVVAYGVVALSDPFEVLIGPYLPRMLQTTLLPFKGRIVYDGIFSAYNITFGPGIRRNLAESYNEAKARYGIVTSLPRSAGEWHPVAKKAATKGRAKTAPSRGGSTAAAGAHAAHDRIVALTDAFCRTHLDDEYAVLCRKLAGVLARKRPTPLTHGKPESWASGIVRVIGWVNFIGDPSNPHPLRLTDIDERIGVSEATGSAKSMAIRNLLKIRRFETEWTLPSRMEKNPMAWMIQVNGLMMDARHAPKEVQAEAFRKGLIPYIPGDQGDESDDG
ncbi:MAG: DUF6398 domain-containing protein [Isosphaeraceae bacterium]